MTDADALFTYQSIKKVRPGVPVVGEIVNGSNVSFLSCEADDVTNDTRDMHFCLQGPFAACVVYVDSLQDKLTVQAFYSTKLLRIIHELVGEAAEPEFMTLCTA